MLTKEKPLIEKVIFIKVQLALNKNNSKEEYLYHLGNHFTYKEIQKLKELNIIPKDYTRRKYKQHNF